MTQDALWELDELPVPPAPRPRFSPVQLARLLGGQEPTPEQAAVISAPLAPLAVIAGAGSGKSETMAARLVWLVANGLAQPERVLGLTFTRKAAAELATRVRSRLDALRRVGLISAGGSGPAALRAAGPDLDGEPVIATYHAYAGRLITDHALREALEPTLRLITPAVAWQLAAKVVAGYDGPMDAVEWAPVTVTAAVLDLAAELAEHLRDPSDVLEAGDWLDQRYAAVPAAKRRAATENVLRTQRVRAQLLPLVRAYTWAKAEREVIDYGDQMGIAARIAMAHPEVGQIERARYQIVLLDEFQDTSHAQLELMRALFGGGHPVTAVGDPCQSIYGWRGASAGNMRRFAANFPAVLARGDDPPEPPEGRDPSGHRLPSSLVAGAPQSSVQAAPGPSGPSDQSDLPAPRAEVRKLSTSFRNTGRVLDVAAEVQRDLRAEAPDVPRLIAPPDRSQRGSVVCALLDTTAAEADWVAAQIRELLELPAGLAPDGKPWPDGRTDSVHPSDVAVLCRRRAQFPALRSALEAEGIPVEVVGLGGLLTVPEVSDIVATLRVLDSPTASDALARTLTSPRWRIGPQDLVALGERARALARSADDEPKPRRNPGDPEDFLTRAVADFTAETGSLVEALDDLGDPSVYSEPGFARLTALATELRALRRHVTRPLPELVTEVERALGLDVEVAARPGVDLPAARADLDAFADAAAAFAGDGQEPTLSAFLAYLTAAETEEFGLEAGQVSDTDSVKLATVHSAKGLQWPAVVVPGLAAGSRSQNFPARARLSTRWTDNPRLLPFWLRGDAADLPELTGLDSDSLTAFGAAAAARNLAEERRLCYVAVTRAAYWLGCSGYWWGVGKSPLGPSVFLDEVRAACEDGAGRVATWAEPPAADAENPALAQPLTSSWPVPPGTAGGRYEAVREGGDFVLAALSDQTAPVLPVPQPRTPDPGPTAPDRRYDELIAGWAADADLLLAERARRRPDGPQPVELPPRIAVSALVTMAADPSELAARIRRPMPRPPSPRAQRGIEFHHWLEERFGLMRLIDADELADVLEADPGSQDAALDELKARFEAGEWGQRWPAAVEVPFETRVSDRLVRGRIDAIFTDAPGGGIDVVDWKTGVPPSAGTRAERAVAVQLAAYRLAWAALSGVPLDQVRAAFYYVREDRTVRPADLLDTAGLAELIDSVPAESGVKPA